MSHGVTDLRGVFAPGATPDTPVVLLGDGPDWFKHVCGGSFVSRGYMKLRKVIDCQGVSVSFVQDLVDERVLRGIPIKWQLMITLGLEDLNHGFLPGLFFSMGCHVGFHGLDGIVFDEA